MGHTVGDDGAGRRWEFLVSYRDPLVAVAYRRGARAEAEDVAHEALLAAAEHSDLDMERAWSFLVTVVNRRVADRYRRRAREATMSQNRAMVPRPRSFEHDLVDRAEARWAVAKLPGRVPAEAIEVVRGMADGATLAQLASERGVTTSALQTRVWRALAPIRAEVESERKRR